MKLLILDWKIDIRLVFLKRQEQLTHSGFQLRFLMGAVLFVVVSSVLVILSWYVPSCSCLSTSPDPLFFSSRLSFRGVSKDSVITNQWRKESLYKYIILFWKALSVAFYWYQNQLKNRLNNLTFNWIGRLWISMHAIAKFLIIINIKMERYGVNADRTPTTWKTEEINRSRGLHKAFNKGEYNP